MSTKPENNMNPDDLPRELRDVSSLLDALGRADGASAPSGLESRIEATVRASLDSQASDPSWLDGALGALADAERGSAPAGLEARIAAETSRVLAGGASASELAEAERLAAAPGLEERVFDATQETIVAAGRPRLRLAGIGSLVGPGGFRLAHLTAAAAALLLVTGGVLVWRASTTAPVVGPPVVIADGGGSDVPVVTPERDEPAPVRVVTVAAVDEVEPDWAWLRDELGPLAQASTGVTWGGSYESSLESDDWCVACELFEAEEGFPG